MKRNDDRRAGLWRRRALMLLLALGLAGPAASAEESRYQIHLLGGTLTPPAGVPSETVRALESRAMTAGRVGEKNVHVLVQLHEAPTPERVRFLAGEGLSLGPYATGNAWVAAVPADRVGAVARSAGVRWLAPWDAAKKLHPRLREKSFGAWTRDPKRPGWVMTFVQLHHDVDLEQGSAIAASVGGVAMDPVEGLHGMTVWLPEGRVAELAEIEEVLWVEEGPMPLSPANDKVRSQMKVDAVAAPPYSLNGSAVRLFVYDGGTVAPDHPTFSWAFGTRATVIDNAPVEDHATHVAGTAVGNGTGSPGGRGLGMAPFAQVFSAGYQEPQGEMLFWDNATDIETDYALAANSYNVDLANNSIGSNLSKWGWPCDREGDYSVVTRLIDQIARGDNQAVGRSLLMVWGNGNERTGACGSNYRTIAPPACAKNPIQVGAINADGGAMTLFSSWGPCDDGRLKPVVVAPGCKTGLIDGEEGIFSSFDWDDYSATLGGFPACGTSMSAPAVSGTLALFIQDWRSLGHGGPSSRPLPALVKAMLAHSAKDLGTTGPDYRHGYGAVDAKALISLLRADNGILGDGNRVQWGTDVLEPGQTIDYEILVASGTSELKATLAWDDPAAEAFAAVTLIHDLTLELVAPDGTVHQAWALSAADPVLPATKTGNSVDNQEQVLVVSPAAGVWKVRVIGSSLPQGRQEFGLAYSASLAPLGTCTSRVWDFERGAAGVETSGSLVDAPRGAGTKSLLLHRLDTLTLSVTIPAGVTRAELDYWWFMETIEEGNWGWDTLSVSVLDPSTSDTLAVLDLRSHGWPQKRWLTEPNLDLTPWAGRTVWLQFLADEPFAFFLPTDNYLDNVKVTFCLPTVPFSATATATSIAEDDGSVIESNQSSNVGGSVSNPAGGGGSIMVGDAEADEQVKGIVSFDTSAIPDNATIVRAMLRVRKSGILGTNPFLTHGAILADIKKWAFGEVTTLTASDFQAVATAKGVAALSPALVNGEWSESYLSDAGLAAINKSGLTQLRLYFQDPDNDDLSSDLVLYNSGGEATAGYRPQLVVLYTQ